jgi:predicted ABC-type ATPase
MAGPVTQFAMESAYRSHERDELKHTDAQGQPKAVVIGGQPGSGKSPLAAQALQEFRSSGGAVLIDADVMRSQNPLYHKLAKEDPQRAADLTHKDAGQWAMRMTVAAYENNRNLVIDGTMRDPASIQRLTRELKSHGYEVDTRIIASNPEMSFTRAQLRYEQEVQQQGVGRVVNREQHDNAYRGVATTVAKLELDPSIDKISVYDRNQNKLYENHRVDGQWERPATAAVVFNRERERPLNLDEKKELVGKLELVSGLTAERTGSVDQAMTYKISGLRQDIAEREKDRSYVVTDAAGSNQRFTSAREAAREFAITNPAGKPEVTRIDRQTDGTYSEQRIAYTAQSQRGGESQRVAMVDGKADPEFSKVATAHIKAEAFARQPNEQVLARHPDLDWAAKEMAVVRRDLGQIQDTSARESYYIAKQREVYDRIKDQNPTASEVTIHESHQVMQGAAQHRGLIVQDSDSLRKDIKGEVVATSTHHALIKISDMVAVQVEKQKISQSVDVGEKVQIQFGAEKSQVFKEGQVPPELRERLAKQR